MNEQDQRIAIAKACGWTHVYWNGGDSVPFGDNPKGNRSPRAYDHLPDYLNDLNACHEMEKVLTDVQYYTDYRMHLSNITFQEQSLTKHFRAMHSATAAQRCEAFLKTIEGWQ